jgi:hypothetical protein
MDIVMADESEAVDLDLGITATRYDDIKQGDQL